MKLLIKTNAENWDESQIVAQGLMRDGYPINSTGTTMTAGDLPAGYLDVWHAVVETLRGDGLEDGARICIMAEASLEHDTQTDDEGTISDAARVILATHWEWADGRMTSETIALDQPAVVALVTYLLDENTYV